MKAIKIHTMYRDACNYKDHYEELFTNTEKTSLEDILQVMQDANLIDEPIMVQDYNIESNAPYDNEFIEANGDDHAFMEITDIEEVTVAEEYLQGAKDISSVLELVLSSREGEFASIRKQEAITKAKEHLQKLCCDESYEMLTVIQINESQIKDDVLERISGKEEFTDITPNGENIGERMYLTSTFGDILEDEEDDTNDTTKFRIKELYEKIKHHDYLMITKI